MDSTYVPAVITGIAGIAGIIINVSVNTWYRYSDIKEKKKEILWLMRRSMFHYAINC